MRHLVAVSLRGADDAGASETPRVFDALDWIQRAVTGRKRARDDADAKDLGSDSDQRRRLHDADGADVGRFVAQIPVGSFRIGASATLDDDDAMEDDDTTVEDEHEVVLDHVLASVDEQEASVSAEDEHRVHDDFAAFIAYRRRLPESPISNSANSAATHSDARRQSDARRVARCLRSALDGNRVRRADVNETDAR